MSAKQAFSVGGMEGRGAYNRHSNFQASGAALALPALERAAQQIALEPANQPVVVADYGSSQVKNSLAPTGLAIRTIRTRVDADRPILVFHTDLPINDFNTLFEVLHDDPDRYTLEDRNVFPAAIGRSFYESVLPAGQVHLGWCSYAAVWLSRIPSRIDGHFVAIRAKDTERAKFIEQAKQDWELFLSLRAKELRPGGRLVVVLPGLDDDGISGFENLMDHANAVLGEMVDEGAIGPDERARMALAAFPRRKCDLLSPFQGDGPFKQLRVEHYELAPLADRLWASYEQDGDMEAMATRRAQFFRAVFVPSLALGLTAANGTDHGTHFADLFEKGLKRRLMKQPAPLHSFVQTLVLAKED